MLHLCLVLEKFDIFSWTQVIANKCTFFFCFPVLLLQRWASFLTRMANKQTCWKCRFNRKKRKKEKEKVLQVKKFTSRKFHQNKPGPCSCLWHRFPLLVYRKKQTKTDFPEICEATLPRSSFKSWIFTWIWRRVVSVTPRWNHLKLADLAKWPSFRRLAQHVRLARTAAQPYEAVANAQSHCFAKGRMLRRAGSLVVTTSEVPAGIVRERGVEVGALNKWDDH